MPYSKYHLRQNYVGQKYFQPFKRNEITGSRIVPAKHAHMCDHVPTQTINQLINHINKQRNIVFQKFNF